MGDLGDAEEQEKTPKMPETAPKRETVPDKGRNTTERRGGEYQSDRGSRRGKYRNGGDRRNNRTENRREENDEKVRPKPTTSHRGGYKNRSNGEFLDLLEN